ncbi:MAG: hypothetical protein ACKVWV_10645 [Planctomycetota bacterium]
MRNHAFALVLPALAALPAASTTSAPTTEVWLALAPPSLCIERPASSRAGFGDGRHLQRAQHGSDLEHEPRVARLSGALWAQMLEEDARARGAKLEFFRGTQDPLVRGDAAAVAAARALTSDLDRAGRAFAIDVEATLTSGSARGAQQPGAAPQHFTARLGSGDAALLGRREVQTYVASFHVEVAADSGVAEPVMGSIRYGTTLYVRAARVDGGKRVFLHGVLDVAELASIGSFDPDTVDLGVVQQPIVHSAQAVFAGTVESGKTLDVTLASPLLSSGEWTLALRATAQPDAEPESEGGWRLFDLAFLASETSPLEPCRPGSALDTDFLASVPTSVAALSPSAIVAALDVTRARSGTRPSILWTSDLLLVPRAEAGLAERASELIRAAESSRLRTGRVELRVGAARTSLPVCAGVPARWTSVVERAWLTDYQADLAPQTWMPRPDVTTTLDGVCSTIVPGASSIQCSSWSAATSASGELERNAAQLGRLQLITRRVTTAATELVPGEPERALIECLGPAPQNGAVVVRYVSP